MILILCKALNHYHQAHNNDPVKRLFNHYHHTHNTDPVQALLINEFIITILVILFLCRNY